MLQRGNALFNRKRTKELEKNTSPHTPADNNGEPSFQMLSHIEHSFRRNIQISGKPEKYHDASFSSISAGPYVRPIFTPSEPT